MNKLTQPVSNDDDDFGPELSEAELDAWFARNRDALNESIAEARRELAEGKAEPWDINEILGDLRAEFEKNPKT
jgi:antitoxin ParD1/3/4